MADDPLPPWLACPDIPAGSIGWRMGAGEEAYDAFYRWFSTLSDPAAHAYIMRNPEPSAWAGHYDLIRANPWK